MSYYQLKYRLEFDDVIEGEFNDYRLDIQKRYEDGSSADASAEMVGSGRPATLAYNVTSDDILSPIRSSYLDIEVYKKEDLPSDEYFDLFLCQNDDFKVFLYKNNILFWQGWMGTSLVGTSHISAPWVIKLRAYDGLNLLKERSYFDNQEVFQAFSNQYNDRYGYHKIKDIIGKCLYFTGLNDSYLNSIYYALRIKHSDDQANFDGEYFVDDTKIHHTTFLDGESKSKNMFDVLDIVLRGLGATIYQRDAQWCIVRISQLTQSDQANDVDFTCRQDYGWVGDAEPTSINYTTQSYDIDNPASRYSSNVDFFQIDGASSLTFQYPLKRIIVKQDNDHNFVTPTTVDAVNDLGSVDPSGLYLFDEWQPELAGDDLDIQEAVVLRDRNYMRLDQISSNLPLKNTEGLPKSLIEADLGVYDMYQKNQMPNLKYPVTHDSLQGLPKVDSDGNYVTKGIQIEFKFRPLGITDLETGEKVRIQFTVRLLTDSVSDPVDVVVGAGGIGSSVDPKEPKLVYFSSQFNDSGTLRPLVFEVDKLNVWYKVKLQAIGIYLGNDINEIGTKQKYEVRLYGGWKYTPADPPTTPATPEPYQDLYDITYTDIKISPRITKYFIKPVEQEYIVEQNLKYNTVKKLEVNIGSNLLTTGKSGFFGFAHTSQNSLISFDKWSIPYEDDLTFQHIVGLSYMQLYRIPVRRLDGMHYGNYKYGDKLKVDNGINGTTGKFFPMGVQIDLKMARTRFTGDDLINNYGLFPSSANYPRSIKWIGEDDITETENY
jgi:hypothetical protein